MSLGHRSAVVLVLFFVAAAGRAPAAPPASSPDNLWRRVEPHEARKLLAARLDAKRGWNRQPSARYFALDAAVLKEVLGRTPLEQARPADVNRVRSEITIPLPDGSFPRFRIEETSVMSPNLAARYPGFRTYRGQGIDDPTLGLRCESTPQGFSAQVLSPRGTVTVNPVGEKNVYTSSLKRDSARGHKPFRCLVPKPAKGARRPAKPSPLRSGQFLRTYRLAVACTHQFAEKRGGTKASVLAAVLATVNRVSGIYERDLAVRLQLVANTDKLWFLDANSDPFKGNNDPDLLLDESQKVIDKTIGDKQYDLGHTFSTGAGGKAGVGVVCRSGEKARGVTGSENPVGDAFDVDYVAHEMGHQLGANHTFNSTLSFCGGGNRNAGTACEPGSGTTIMGYAGICGLDNVQDHTDDYFHSVSLEEIIRCITSAGGPSPTPTGNTPPTVTAGASYTVPRQTPFQLTASGSDADGDPLSYCWEQRDLGPAASLQASDDGQIPLFRSIRPSASSSRCFPQLSDVLSSRASPGEQLPSRGRTMTFRVTVRDNRSGGGGVCCDDLTVTVAPSAGPFRVTFPDATSPVQSGLLQVTWDVAGTDAAPVGTAFVDILLSTDGGMTFPSTLAASVPNDGAHLVTLPAISTSTARIKVQSVGNIFFAVSRGNFSIQPASSSILVVPSPGGPGEATRTLDRLLLSANIDDVYTSRSPAAMTAAARVGQGISRRPVTYSAVDALKKQLDKAPESHRAVVLMSPDEAGQLVRGLGGEATPKLSPRSLLIINRVAGRTFVRRVTRPGEPPPAKDKAGPRPGASEVDKLREEVRELKKAFEALRQKLDQPTPSPAPKAEKNARRPAPLPASYNQMIPTSLSRENQKRLRDILTQAGAARPGRFIPARATVKTWSRGVPVDFPADPNANVKEYLAAVLPHPSTDRAQGPDTVDVYWYRPNPEKKSPGVTVKQVINLSTGKKGDPEVLIGYPAPLTPEEREEALELAAEKIPEVKKLLDAGRNDLRLEVLFETLTSKTLDGTPGDRLVSLEVRKKGEKQAVAVNVNVTKKTVRRPDGRQP